MSALLAMPLTALIEAYRTRRISPVEVVDAVLAQIDRTEPVINAFVVRGDADIVRKEAAASAARWREGRPLGPLDGVPITVKDAILTRRWATRAGSHVTSSAPGDSDAPAVARALEAGAIILGKTTTPEFGWKAVTDSPLTGISRNPWDPAMTPGGSSGGAAAAVAAGAAFASIGTDAGGSVRIPAAFCGLAGLKATRGRIPAFPPSAVWTAGHIGPIARSVGDVAVMLKVMSRPDARDWNALPPVDDEYPGGLVRDGRLEGLKIAYSRTLGHAKVDPSVATIVDRTAHQLEVLGAVVEEVEAPLPDAREPFFVYFSVGLAHSLRRLSNEERERLDPGLVVILEKARNISRDQFLEAYDFQVSLSRAARLFHQTFDLLVTPTVAVPAFAAGKLAPAGYDPENWLDWSPFTYPFNLSGQPAMSVCCGYTAQGLPVGLQLVGPYYGEPLMLRVAQALEDGWPAERLLPPCLATA